MFELDFQKSLFTLTLVRRSTVIAGGGMPLSEVASTFVFEEEGL
jgi:hypothetical protein